MNHDDWVRREIQKFSKSLGFQYTPLDEINSRLSRIRACMERQGMEVPLVVQKMNLYYLSGTAQDSLLFIPLEGKALLMVKRELERARAESPLEEIVPFT